MVDRKSRSPLRMFTSAFARSFTIPALSLAHFNHLEGHMLIRYILQSRARFLSSRSRRSVTPLPTPAEATSTVAAKHQPSGRPQQLTIHSRRMQAHHGIVPQMHQIPPRDKRPRMSQSIQILPFLPNGAVRTGAFLCPITPALRPHTLRLHPDIPCLKPPFSIFQAREGKGLVIPPCQSDFDRVFGTLQDS